MKKMLLEILIILVLILLVGCVLQSKGEEATALTLPTTTLIIPKDTATVPSLTPGPTEGVEQIQIMSRVDAIQKSKELILINGKCELPCIWGITPGKTTFREAKTLLAPLGEIAGQYSSFESPNGGVDIYFPIDGSNIHAGLWYINNPTQGFTDQEIASIQYQLDAFITISGDGYTGVETVYHSESYAELVKFYSLQQVLHRLGAPDKVMLETISQYAPSVEGIEQPSTMSLVVIYPDKGVMVEYITTINIANASVEGCFIAPEMTFELIEPKERTTESFVGELGTQWKEQLQYYLPIDQATNYTNKSFYDHFTNANNSCISTPAKLWPRPD